MDPFSCSIISLHICRGKKSMLVKSSLTHIPNFGVEGNILKNSKKFNMHNFFMGMYQTVDFSAITLYYLDNFYFIKLFKNF